VTRLPVLTTAWLGLPMLAACGTNLLIVAWPAELRAANGERVPVILHYREPEGFLQSSDPPLHAPLVGLLCEPLDWLQSTTIAALAVVRSDWQVAGGPFGWLASLTPFATLVPQLHLPPPATAAVDDAALASLRDGDDGPARAAWNDPRLVRITTATSP
jgi:hypothetical protein